MDCSKVLVRIFGSRAASLNSGELSQVAGFLNGLDPRSQMQMCCVLSWGLSLNESHQAEVKLVGGYTNQPLGYNQVPTLLLAVLGPSGKAVANEWFLRIPLETPLTVTLPDRRISNSVTEPEIVRGKDTNYSPRALEDFLKRPDHYTKLS